MDSVFIVQHVHTLPSGVEDVKLIGVYRDLGAAKSAVGRLRGLPGFIDHPATIDPGTSSGEDGFYISENQLNCDNWTEGFVTMVGGREYRE